MIISALRNSNGIDYVVTFDTDKDPKYTGVKTVGECRRRAIEIEAGMMNARDWREGRFPDTCLWHKQCDRPREDEGMAWCKEHTMEVVWWLVCPMG